jgi:integrative and conjugative element protein (TIGR02256 family)
LKRAENFKKAAPAVLKSMDFIIDASASVSVARWLALNADRAAPAASCFLNPAGTDAVVLAEGDGPVPRLDHLEMSYYWRLINETPLQGHLQGDNSSFSVGACRTPSAQIPQTRVASLAALAAEVLSQVPRAADGQIVVWRNSASGITRHSYGGEQFVAGQLHNWAVLVRKPLLAAITDARKKARKRETGGIIAGTWDRDRNIIYVVGHFDPPPDSHHEPTGFIRGTVGVHRTIQQVESATAGNMTYIGEWHTHPPGYTSKPSSDDHHLLRWVHDALQWSDAPALILIAGEDGFRVVLLDEGSMYSELLIDAASLNQSSV